MHYIHGEERKWTGNHVVVVKILGINFSTYYSLAECVVSKCRRSEYLDKTRGLGAGDKRRNMGMTLNNQPCERGVQIIIF